MKEKFLDGAINLIAKYQKINEGDTLKLRYGLEGLYLTTTKTAIIFVLAFIFGIFKEMLILLLLFNIVRFTGFGFHAKKSWECLLVSILSFVMFPFLLLNLYINKNVLFITGILGTIYLFFYAPADTIKRPLPNKRKRVIRKIITVSTATIFTIIALFLNEYRFSLLLTDAVVLEDVMVSPITYKVFKQPYKNYVNYKRKNGLISIKYDI